MTEKRFNDVKGYVYDKKNCIGFIQDDYTCENIINTLNEQHEENMLLIEDTEKHRKLAIQFDNHNKELVRENALLEKENEQLKSNIQDMQTGTYINAKNIIRELKEENEQFHNIANDYNIPFDKLCETFEQCLDENEQLKKEIKDMKIRFKRKYDHEFDEIVDELW